MDKIAISISVGTQNLIPQIEKILQVLHSIDNVEPLIVLAGHKNLDPKGYSLAQKALKKYPNQLALAIAEKGTFSSAYLLGWEVSLKLGADFVISIDADGSHEPEELIKFISEFRKGNKAVFSSRFMPRAENSYPYLRQLLSLGVTTITNMLLKPKNTPKLTDFASGYEGLHKSIVERVLYICPPNEWISVTVGPYHLQNTILRLLTLYAGYTIKEIPITYGAKRKGKVLGLKYVFKALYGFRLLLKKKDGYIKKAID